MRNVRCHACDERTDARKVESRAVFSLSWIRNKKYTRKYKNAHHFHLRRISCPQIQRQIEIPIQKKAQIQNGQEWHSSSILPSTPSSCLGRGPPTETLNGAGERRTDGSTVDLNKYNYKKLQKYNMSFWKNCSTLSLNNFNLKKIQDWSISDQYYKCRI